MLALVRLLEFSAGLLVWMVEQLVGLLDGGELLDEWPAEDETEGGVHVA